MTLLGGRRGGLAQRLATLDEVLALARGRIDDDALGPAQQLADKAGGRLRFGAEHTVVALAGATGGGKSSLFNALAGQDLSAVGMRRPTTGTAQAAVWGEADAGPLLDWLDVARRHLVAGGGPDLDGLVLLDLPDVDSVRHGHRLTAERLVERVDLMVWVLDPQKYADAAVHERYLVPLAGHADVTLVVLNQVDRLSARARAGCLADLGRLLRDEGLSAAAVLPASAATGEGLDALRAELARRTAARRASVRGLEADLAGVAQALAAGCTGTAADAVPRAQQQALVSALGDAAGADLVTSAVARTHRLRARQATGWPFTRWLTRLRPDPARRFRLRDHPDELVRTSLPGPSAVQRARLDLAVGAVVERATDGLPPQWHPVLRGAATASRERLPDLLDRAVAGTDLGLAQRPRWWRAVGLLQLLLAATAVAGLAWLTALFAVDWLRLPDPPLPDAGPLPVPTLLLAAGLLLGLVVARLGAACAAVGARRRARLARRRLDERIAALAREAVLDPVERELHAHTELRRALARLGG